MRILGVISRLQRANAAPALCTLRATAALPYPQAAELRCLALLHCCMIEERWLWRLLSCRMQDIWPPILRRCGFASKADLSWQADQPHLSLRPCLPLRDRQTVASAPRRFCRRYTDRRQVECGASTHFVRHTKRETARIAGMAHDTTAAWLAVTGRRHKVEVRPGACRV